VTTENTTVETPAPRHMVAMFPWLILEEAVATDAFRLVPYQRGEAPAGKGMQIQTQLDAAFAPFHVGMQSVKRATLLQIGSHGLTDELAMVEEADETEDAFEYAEMVAFSGLAARDFKLAPALELGYCNRADFALFLQQFRDMPEGAVVVARRRHNLGAWTVVTYDAYRETAPRCITSSQFLRLDEPLLRALVAASRHPLWGGRLWEAIWQFNHANTDSDEIRPQMEAVMTVSAFERLFDLRTSDEDGLARAFVDAFRPAPASTWDACARRDRKPKKYAPQPIREVWIRDFFQYRGHTAHGRFGPPSGHPLAWDLHEHLLLGAIAFPLAAKCVLAREGLYAMSDHDQQRINRFERVAGRADNITGKAT
jgi:hypothetical protein